MTSQTDSEREDELKVLRQLYQELKNHPPVALHLSARDAWVFIGMIQLAFRHPANSGKTAESVKSAVVSMQNSMLLSADAKEWLNRGWNPEYDRQTDKLNEFVTVKTEDFLGLSLAFGMACNVAAFVSGSTYEEIEKTARMRALEKFEEFSDETKVQAMQEYYNSVKND